MADLGVIGTKGNLSQSTKQFQPMILRKIVVGALNFSVGTKSTSEGELQPSLELKNRGMFRFRWIVEAGTRTISVRVKQAVNLSPRPTLTVKANSEIGVSSDVTGTAGSSTGWVTIGPVTITPTSKGAVWVELNANYDGQDVQSYWDNVAVT